MKTQLTTISIRILCILCILTIAGCGSNDTTKPPPGSMVLIPAGEFQMGLHGTVYDSHPEQPVHTVSVDAFYMDVYEVTNAQFKVFVDASPDWEKDWGRSRDGAYLWGWEGNNYPPTEANHPVMVNWYAAMAYAQWAGKRLPTEAEWEYAARGGLEGKKYPWGDTITLDDANYDDEPDGGTTPVGNYAPNGYGLYDMAGNVWEWCLDAYEPDFYERSPAANPIAGGEVNNFTEVDLWTKRVLRGGSWLTAAQDVRVALRHYLSPLLTGGGIGFRCAMAVTP